MALSAKVPAVFKTPEMKAFVAMVVVFTGLNVAYHMSPGFRSIFTQ